TNQVTTDPSNTLSTRETLAVFIEPDEKDSGNHITCRRTPLLNLTTSIDEGAGNYRCWLGLNARNTAPTKSSGIAALIGLAGFNCPTGTFIPIYISIFKIRIR